MRCPKCSFISFDDLAVCAKCANDLSVLSKELNGTCIEARTEFYLGSAIQAPSLDDDSFSDSQILPPIDHAGINFDDTSTGGFAPLPSSSSSSASLDLDDSIGMSTEDDVAIELGDIMPIDLDQLDDTSVFTGESLVDTNSFDSGDFALDLDKTETMNVSDRHAVDHDLTGKFSSTNSDLELDGDFSDIDLDESTIDFANVSSPPVAKNSSGSFASGSSELPANPTPFDDSGSVNLDDDLIAQLVSFNDDLDSTANLSKSSSIDASDISKSLDDRLDADTAPIDLDDSLVAELTGAFPVNNVTEEISLDYSEGSSGSGEFELDSALVAELAADTDADEVFLDVDLEELAEGEDVIVSSSPTTEAAVETPIEDLTGEFSPINISGDTEIGDLGLSDIDVGDLVESPADLAGAGDAGMNSVASSSVWDEGQSVKTDDFSNGLDSITPIEDLTGEFPPIEESDAAGEGLEGLSLTEIDVSDLLEASVEENVPVSSEAKIGHQEAAFAAGESVSVNQLQTAVSALKNEEVLSTQDTSTSFDSEHELLNEIDLSGLEGELPGEFDVQAKGLDEALPEIELIPEDEEPPDLPR